MNSLSLKHKLFTIFTGFIIVFSLFGIYAIITKERFAETSETIYEHPMKVSNASLEAINGIIRMQKSMKQLLIVKDKQQFFILVDDINKNERKVYQQLAIVHEQVLGEEGRALALKVHRQFDAWRPLRTQVIALIKEGKKKEAMSISKAKYSTFMLGLEKDIESLISYARVNADKFINEAKEARRSDFIYTTFYALAVFLGSIVVAVLFGKNILKQVGRDPKELSEMAEQISKGNLDIDIDHENSSGIYKVMCEMIIALNNAKDNENARRWLRSGLVDLDNSIRGQYDIKKMTKIMVDYLATYTSSMIGSIYIANSSKTLELYAGYSIDRDFPLSTKFEWGEGLIGRVAETGQPQLFKEVPENYVRIRSSIGEIHPKELYIAPFTYDNQVVGVIELGSDKSFSEASLELIDRVAENAGVSLNMAKSQSRVTELLKQTQKQAEELQQQQEELRVSNEELEEQTKLLQASEKRLQQQQEELRVTNEELEERSSAIEQQRDEIKKQNAMLTQAQIDITKKAQALEDASRYKSEFLANMSHELRTPLNSILILSQLLSGDKKGNLDDKQKEFANTIFKSGTNLLNLINDILDLSKIEAGRLDLNIENVNLSKMINDISSEIKPLAVDKKISFEIDHSENLPETIGTDAIKLTQVIKNLLSNAVKFTEKGSVTLSAGLSEKETTLADVKYEAGEVINISVADTGVGIPEDKIEHIFKAFRQVDGTTSRKYGGTGLGLTICKRICGLLGGNISLTSKPGEGSTFLVQLPLKTPAVKAKPEKTEPVVSAQLDQTFEDEPINDSTVEDSTLNDDSLIGENTLLLIEDDPSFVNILWDIAEDRGYKPIVASTGEKGLHMADYYKPKAIILDISLPGMDGYQVMKRLKDNPETKSIPVHFISGTEDTMKAMHMGAIGFLQKPVTTASLEDAFMKIENVLEKAVKNLLIVEDNDIQRQSIVELIGNGDVISTAVSTGEAAYKHLLSNEFDCMILDLGLEDMDGLQFLNRIKNNENIKDIPVIVYTGKDLTHEEERILQQYAGSIIIKGARSPERLLAETSLFLHRVEKDLPESKRAMLENKDNESVLEGKKILLADDDMRNVFALSSVLEENGLIVEMAENGQEAVDKLLADKDIDLVLMDIMMPVMDGYEAIGRIREDSRIKDKPIIALTAKAMPNDRAKCIEAGANEYMAKPVNIDKLLSLLRVWLYK